MRDKQVNGPVGAILIAVIVILVLGAGYWFMNKDSMGKEAQARKLGPPGTLAPGTDPKIGPFPNENSPSNSSKLPAGIPPPGVPASGARTPSGGATGGQ